jgi:LDH2 family malate/lactate/ureidoglycolate dehydrogenase
LVERALAAGWGQRVLMSLGAGAVAARQTINHLLAAQDAGHPSHGLRMLISIAATAERGDVDLGAAPVVEARSGSAVRIDGRRGLGPPIGLLATTLAVNRAQTHGTSAVAVRAAGQFGRLAPFAEIAADSGCALFVCANDAGANQHVAPAGGREPRLSTNPIAFGFPRAAPPHLVVDMATSAYAHGALAVLRESERPLPDDALLPGTEDLMLPMAGHKGFALALMVEALAGALTGAGVVVPNPQPEAQGALFVAVDVAALAPLEDATEELERAIAWVRSASPSDAGPVRIPGENRAAGAGAEVSIAARQWRQLVALSETLKVDVPPRRLASH